MSAVLSGIRNCLLVVSYPERDTLRERAQEFWLVLDDVSITDLTFSPEYTVPPRLAPCIHTLYLVPLDI